MNISTAARNRRMMVMVVATSYRTGAATPRAIRFRAGPAGPRGDHVRMLAKTQSFVLIGIDPLLCEIEVDCRQRGLEKTTVVGLAQAAVKESIERVRRAIINSGFAYT